MGGWRGRSKVKDDHNTVFTFFCQDSSHPPTTTSPTLIPFDDCQVIHRRTRLCPFFKKVPAPFYCFISYPSNCYPCHHWSGDPFLRLSTKSLFLVMALLYFIIYLFPCYHFWPLWYEYCVSLRYLVVTVWYTIVLPHKGAPYSHNSMLF